MLYDTNTPFCHLMEMFKIKSDTICTHLFVSKALVSKWKHGTRKIGAEHAKRLAEFFYDFDSEGQLGKLVPVLCGIFPTRELKSKDECVESLALWLMRIVKPQAVIKSAESDFSGTFEMFFGRAGLLKAIRLAADAITDQEYFYCLNADNVEWFTKKTFAHSWLNVLEDLFSQKNVKMRLINRMDWRIGDVKNIIEPMLWWNVLGRIDSVFYTGGGEHWGDSFVILVPRVAVIKVNYDLEAEDGIACSVFFDKHTLARCLNECQRLFFAGQNLIRHNIFESGIDLPRVDGAFYVVSNNFPVLPAKPQMLQAECGLSDDEITKALKHYPALFDCTGARYILSRAGLKNALKGGGFYNSVLSGVFGKDIVLSSEFLASCGKHLIKKVSDTDCCLFVLNDETYFPKLNMLLTKDYAFCLAGVHNAFFNNMHLLDFVNSFYNEKYSELMHSPRSLQMHLDDFAALLTKS